MDKLNFLFLLNDRDWSKSYIPEGCLNRHTELCVSLEEIQLEVAKVDALDAWDGDTGSKQFVDGGDLGVNLGLDIVQDLVRSKTKSNGEVWTESSNRWLSKVSENGSTFRVNNGLGGEVIELSDESNLVLDHDGDSNVSNDGLAFCGESSDDWFFD